jgi:hypothetical protein
LGGRGEYRPPGIPPPFSYASVVFVSLAVEYARSVYHPELYNLIPHPNWLVFGSLMATFAYHVWDVPESPSKGAASALFTQTSMPSVLLITVKAAQGISAACQGWLSDMTKVF